MCIADFEASLACLVERSRGLTSSFQGRLHLTTPDLSIGEKENMPACADRCIKRGAPCLSSDRGGKRLKSSPAKQPKAAPLEPSQQCQPADNQRQRLRDSDATGHIKEVSKHKAGSGVMLGANNATPGVLVPMGSHTAHYQLRDLTACRWTRSGHEKMTRARQFPHHHPRPRG